MEAKKEPSEEVQLTTTSMASTQWPDVVPPVIYFPPRKNGRIVRIWGYAQDPPATTKQTDENNF